MIDYRNRLLRSAILYPKDTLYKIVHSLNEKDFEVGDQRKAFAILKQAAKDELLDQTLIMDRMDQAGISGTTILNSWDGYYGGESIDEIVKLVHNRANLRKLKRIYQDGLQDVSKVSTDAEKNIRSFIRKISMVNGIRKRTLAEQVDELERNWKRYAGRQIFGQPTGLKTLDWITKGMERKRLWLLGGYTSFGKSWYAVQLARQNFLNGQKTLFISQEMSSEEILWRMAVQEMDDPDITIFKAKTMDFDLEKQSQFKGVLKLVRKYPVIIEDDLTDWDQIKLNIIHHIYSHKVKAVVVDYVQNITVKKTRSEYESLNRIVRDLQRMAVQYDIFVLVLSQVNRESQKTDTNKVFGFKGSGNLENAADIAMTLNKIDDDTKRVLAVGKNRVGITGKVLCEVDFARGYINDTGLYDESPMGDAKRSVSR